MKTISVLGSTGSIGTQTLAVARKIGARVVALTTNRSVDLIIEQALEFSPTLVVAFDLAASEELRRRLPSTIMVMGGMEGLIAAASIPQAQIVVTAVVGMVGLLPTLAAIEAGKDIALANKETLVCAGAIVMEKAAARGVKILPVDSEHSAIFQCIQGAAGNSLKKVILTASGGPFFGKTTTELAKMTRSDALKHPNWTMGAKITIDSATLMNKGLELIEAMWLYDMAPEDIEILVHRESIVHSLIEFSDHSVLAQMGTPDMKLPIQYALTYPKRQPSDAEPLSLAHVKNLSFYEADPETFVCLKLAIEAAKKKGNSGAILNGANEVAVALFLEEKIGFLEIGQRVAQAMETVPFIQHPSLEDILESDKQARASVNQIVR